MSKLEWDLTGERLYETGVRKGVLYPFKSNAYQAGVAWNGLASISESPSGADETKIYADDIKYLSLRAVEEFGGTIEAYMFPDEWYECDGQTITTSGVVIGQQKRIPFGLCYRTAIGNDTEFEDHGYKIHLIYNATVSPSERSYSTINDSPEVNTMSWEFATTPTAVEGYKPTSLITISSLKADAAKLAALEDILYGSASSDARLPMPAEVLTLMEASTTTVTTGD